MGWFSDAFGGDPELKMRSRLSSKQQGIADRLGSYLQDRTGKAMQQYKGPRVAPMTSYEQQGLGALGNYMQGPGTYMPQRQQAYGQALGGSLLPDIDMSEQRKWFESRVAPQYRQAFQQMAAPAMEQVKAMGGGASSSAMNRAIAEQAGGLGRYLGDIGYDYLARQQAAQQQRQREQAGLAMQAMGMQEPLQQQQLAMAAASQSLGSLPRMIQQMQMDTDFQEWLRTRPEYSPVITQALQFIAQNQTIPTIEQDQGWVRRGTDAMNQVTDFGTAALSMIMPSTYVLGTPAGQAMGGSPTRPGESSNGKNSKGGMLSSILGLMG